MLRELQEKCMQESWEVIEKERREYRSALGLRTMHPYTLNWNCVKCIHIRKSSLIVHVTTRICGEKTSELMYFDECGTVDFMEYEKRESCENYIIYIHISINQYIIYLKLMFLSFLVFCHTTRCIRIILITG